MDTAEARREERALRRAERAEIRAQEAKQAVEDVLMIVAVLIGMYAFMFFGCTWASM